MGLCVRSTADKEGVMFDFFNLGSRACERRAETMLREARFAQLEHEAAAEHHDALARMYADRVLRLEGARRYGLRKDSATTMSPQAAVPAEKFQHEERAPLRVLSPAPPPVKQALG